MDLLYNIGFPDSSVVKNLPAIAGDEGSIPGSTRSPGGGNGHPLQHSCLENPVDRGAWQATVYGVAKELYTTQGLNNTTTKVNLEGIMLNEINQTSKDKY